MEANIDPDFDPTTTEGQDNIIDTVDDEYETLLKRPDESADAWHERLRNRFGRGVDYARGVIKYQFRFKNPGKTTPLYMDTKPKTKTVGGKKYTQQVNEPEEEYELEDLGQRAKMQREIIENVRGRFPNMDLGRLDFQIGDRGQVQVRDGRKMGKWKNLYQVRDPEKMNNQLPKEIKDALGPPNLTEQLKENNENIELQKRAIDLEDKLGEAEQNYAVKAQALSNLQSRFDRVQEEYEKALAANEERHNLETENFLEDAEQRYNSILEERNIIANEANKALRERDRARADLDETAQELGMAKTDITALRSELEASQREKADLEHEVRTKEEQIRQMTQAIEDLEGQVERQREIIADQTRPEEERAEAQKTLETLLERVEEMKRQKDNLERELGLTTKEKIKRALLKYGVPLAFATVIAATSAVIITALKGVGNGVKKLGRGLTELGKKMAASIPGLLGTVLSLVLKTGGELLKFVGNNIWILVVAVGAILLKKLKI